MRTRFLLLGLSAAVSACGESPLSPTEFLRLADAEARWAARPFPDYAFEIRQACFCAPELTQWARVEVVGGQISRVVVLATGVELPPLERSYFPTVERVFSSIHSASDDDYLRDIRVEYDHQLGYPTRVDFVSKPEIADGGGTYYLRNAGPAPSP
jgi:hypothetical protein